MSMALPRSIESYLRAFERRRRMLELIRSAGFAAALGAAWMLALGAVDRAFALSGRVRLALLAGAGLSILAMFVWAVLRTMLSGRSRIAAAARLEAADPALEGRLRTLVWQMGAPANVRGSAELLEALAADLERLTARRSPSRGMPWIKVMAPWAAALALGLALLGLMWAPGLEARSLLRRVLLPMADTLPVTGSRIRVVPGNVTLAQGSALEVRALVPEREGVPVDLFTSRDGSSWSRAAMLPRADAEYRFALPSVDRDLLYFLAQGEDRTPAYNVRVLRAPAVIEHRVRLEHPPYIEAEPVIFSSPNAVIEGLRGSRVELRVKSTERLREAAMTLGEQRVEGIVEEEGETARFTFAVRAAEEGRLRMTSEGGVSSEAPLRIRLRADEEPAVRLLLPSDAVYLNARDALVLEYDASDDFGIAQAAMRVSVNDGPARVVAMGVSTASTEIRERLEVDLGGMGLSVGDVLGVQIEVSDGLGQVALSAKREALIGVASVADGAQTPVGELQNAAELAAASQRDLSAGAGALRAVRRRPNSSEGGAQDWRPATGAAIAESIETLNALHRSLLRAMGKGSRAQLATALAALVDSARVNLSAAERLASLEGAGIDADVLLTEMQPLLNASRALAEDVKTVARGELAAAVLAERANLRSVQGRGSGPWSGRVAKALEARMASSLAALGLGGRSDEEIDRHLQGLAAESRRLLNRAELVDFQAVSGEWVLALVGTARAVPPLAQRLASASAAEALRSDGDPRRAHDLRLASLAALKLQQRSAAAGRPDAVGEALVEFPDALEAVEQEHAVTRSAAEAGVNLRSANPEGPVATAAGGARRRMQEWAQVGGSISTTAPAGDTDELLALRAGFHCAARDYAAAAALDRRLSANAAARGIRVADTALSRLNDAAREIDDALLRQTGLMDQIQSLQRGAFDEAGLRSLGEQQRDLAEQIGRIDSTADGITIRPAGGAADGIPTAGGRISIGGALERARAHSAMAAEMLGRRPFDAGATRSQQEAASLSLEQAWGRSVRGAYTRRLLLAPSFRITLLDAPSKPVLRRMGKTAAGVGTGTGGAGGAPTAAGASDEEALRIYFQAIRKAHDEASDD